MPAHSGVRLISADLSNIRVADRDVGRFAPEVIVHLAWKGIRGAARDDPAQALVNVPAALHLLELAHRCGARAWIGMGSQAEYGERSGVLTETTPAEPVTAYGAAKLAAGVLSQQLCAVWGIRAVWFRLFAAYGPRDVSNWLIPTVIRQLLAGRRPSLTSGEQLWDCLYIDDVVDAIMTAIDGSASGIYNLASGDARPIREIAEIIRDMIDPSLALGFGEVPPPPRGHRSLQPDISRLVQDTAWRPKIDLRVGLHRTVEWFDRGAGL